MKQTDKIKALLEKKEAETKTLGSVDTRRANNADRSRKLGWQDMSILWHPGSKITAK